MTDTRKRIRTPEGVEYWETTEPGDFSMTLCSDGEHPINKALGESMRRWSEDFFRKAREASICFATPEKYGGTK